VGWVDETQEYETVWVRQTHQCTKDNQGANRGSVLQEKKKSGGRTIYHLLHLPLREKRERVKETYANGTILLFYIHKYIEQNI
jgi:hypothetical protein